MKRFCDILMSTILIVVLLRLLWRIIRPYILKMQPNAEVKGTGARPDPSIKIDENQIEDAKFTEIKESENDSEK